MAEQKKRKLTAAEVESRGDNLAELAKKYKTIAGIPESHIHATSEDKKTVVLLDGTRVTDADLKAAAKPDKDEK